MLSINFARRQCQRGHLTAQFGQHPVALAFNSAKAARDLAVGFSLRANFLFDVFCAFGRIAHYIGSFTLRLSQDALRLFFCVSASFRGNPSVLKPLRNRLAGASPTSRSAGRNPGAQHNEDDRERANINN
jgi:hypothetical protein